jgi:hypothetical protein
MEHAKKHRANNRECHQASCVATEQWANCGKKKSTGKQFYVVLNWIIDQLISGVRKEEPRRMVILPCDATVRYATSIQYMDTGQSAEEGLKLASWKKAGAFLRAPLVKQKHQRHQKYRFYDEIIDFRAPKMPV